MGGSIRMYTEEQIKSMSADELRVALRIMQNKSIENNLISVGTNVLQNHGVSGKMAVLIATGAISGVIELINNLFK